LADRLVADSRGSTSPALTTDPYGSPDQPLVDELSKVLAAVDSVEDFQTSWVSQVEKRYRAYRGIAEKRREKTQSWRSQLTTPYLLQVVEGMLATMLEPAPKWQVTPRPMPGEPLQDILARGQSGDVASSALQWAMDEDDFEFKQRPFMQQDLIAGMTVAKCVWAYESKDMNRLLPVEMEVADDFGAVVDRYMSTEEQTQHVCMRDGPSMIVRDVRDFFWPQSAKSVEDAAWIVDRSWETWDALKAKEDAGLFKGVDELKEARNIASSEYSEREQSLWGRERNKDLIEVLEYWSDERVITVGARKVVRASRDNPLRIKRKPFVVCSAMPDAFQMVGLSVIEALAQLQEYLWTLQNQRLDALRLLTNVVTLVRSDVDDPDSFEYFPGAQWIVEDPGQVSQLPIDATAGQLTLEAEGLIKGDLQNLLGGLPFAGGADSVVQGAGGSTATGMSIITSVAQRLIQARKQHYLWAFSKVGEMFLGMMGQMLREQRVISQVGPSGQQLLQIHPLDLQGEFDIKVDVLNESSIRQEKISEAMALWNTVMPLIQVGMVDPQPYLDKLLDAYGIQEKAQFAVKQPPTPGQAPAAPGQPSSNGTPTQPSTIQQNLQPTMNPVGSQGQTNPALAAGMGGQSNGPTGLAMSPDQFAQGQIQAVQQLGLGAQGG